MNLVDIVNTNQRKSNADKFPAFKSGDTIEVHARITEGAKSRIQLFEGVCIGIRRKKSVNGCFTVRKVSSGVGVERIFPFHGPSVEAVKIIQKGKSRKGKLYYLRERSGKAARISIDYDNA